MENRNGFGNSMARESQKKCEQPIKIHAHRGAGVEGQIPPEALAYEVR